MPTSLSPGAAQQICSHLVHYEAKLRTEAIRILLLSIEDATAKIDRPPLAGLTAPRPYPEMAHDGSCWIKQGRYWFGYTLTTPPVVVAVFFETADIPTRR